MTTRLMQIKHCGYCGKVLYKCDRQNGCKAEMKVNREGSYLHFCNNECLVNNLIRLANKVLAEDYRQLSLYVSKKQGENHEIKYSSYFTLK